MATKRITELALRSDFGDTCNVPVDDTVQTYRVTGAQIWDFIKAKNYNALIVAKSADYTILDDDDVRTISMTTGATNRTVTLPNAANNANRLITVIKVDVYSGGVAKVTDGITTYNIPGLRDSVTFQSDGSAWIMITDSRKEFQYTHSTVYNGVTLSITGSSLSIYGAVFVPYKTANGVYRLRANLELNPSTATRTQYTATIAGVTFKTVASTVPHVMAAMNSANMSLNQCYCEPAGGAVTWNHNTASTNGYYAAFDVELASKPTWSFLD